MRRVLQLAVVGEPRVVGIVDRLHATSVAGRGSTRTHPFDTIEHVFYQGSLFGTLTPEYDATFAEAHGSISTTPPGSNCVPGWLSGADEIFDELAPPCRSDSAPA